jgi:hypothetical protein
MSSFLNIPDPKDSIVKITATCYKRPDVSWEYFIQYWRNTHVFKFTRNPRVERLLLGYVQVSRTKQCTYGALVANCLECHRDDESSTKMGPVPLLDYDGLAEFYVKNIEDWLEIASDPQHLAESMTDMDHFCDSPRMKLFITNYEPRFWKIPNPPPPPSKGGKEVEWNHPDPDKLNLDPKFTKS